MRTFQVSKVRALHSRLYESAGILEVDSTESFGFALADLLIVVDKGIVTAFPKGS